MSNEQTSLSDREMELVRLLATGATNREIARDMKISVNTVKVHLRNIYGKLGVASRTEATMVAVRQGWVAVPRTEEQVEEAGPAEEALPRLERWARVSLVKRIGLVVASLLALAALFLPQALQGRTNSNGSDPFLGVFPTAVSGTSSGRWHTNAQMPTPRSNLAVAALGNLVYAIGGVGSDGVTGKVEIYDPQADAWTAGRSKPTPASFVSAVVVGDKIYVPGGIDDGLQPLDVLEVYDPAANRWESRASMPKALGAYGLAAFEGQIYLFGGRDEEGYVASTYRYDPESDSWQALAPMAQERGLLSAASIEDGIYVVGGFDGIREFNDLDVYDPATDAWTSRSAMELRRGGLALAAVREQLYAIGGGIDGYLAFNERYDPRIDRWRRIETPVTGQWRGPGVAFVYPYLYAIGGWNGANLSVNESFQALYQLILP